MVHIDAFDTTIQETNQILNSINAYFHQDKSHRYAYGALRSVLHALRDRMPVSVAAHFSAQLPLLVKGIFYDQWDPEAVPVKMNRQEFMEQVEMNFPYAEKPDMEEMIRVTLDTLKKYVTPGLMEEVKQVMPGDIQELFESKA